LVFVSALAVGDYLLWNWSLSANHALLALLAGLTLPPLALAFVWLLALGLARALAGAARRRPALDSGAMRRRAALIASDAAPQAAPEPVTGAGGQPTGDSRKLAA
jgi:hypothetical protein